MPVDLLFCEGGPQSPDLRVLNLVSGAGVLRPTGSKYGLGNTVKAHRDASPASVIAGIRDRDFDDDETPPRDEPRRWDVEGGAVWIGFYWERREIENYLIDPIVVTKALGSKAPDRAGYQNALQSAANSLSCYTAARVALSLARKRFTPLSSSWGRKRGKIGNEMPDDLSEAACRQGIRENLIHHQQEQVPPENDVLSTFASILPTCQTGGIRRQHFVTFFSGKDLLCVMDSDLRSLGFKSSYQFQETVLKGIESSADDVFLWMPEWKVLHDTVQTITNNRGI